MKGFHPSNYKRLLSYVTYVFTIGAALIISLYAVAFTFVPVTHILGLPPNSLGFFFPGLGTFLLIGILMLIYSTILGIIAHKLYLHRLK